MKALGAILFVAAGIPLYIFEVVWFARWWDGLGLIIGVFLPPVAAFFPLVYLAKEGFSAFYFGLWAIGLLGVVLVGVAVARE